MAGSAILGSSLVDDLVPMVDELRADLHEMAGIRQYRVFLERVRWEVGTFHATHVGEGVRGRLSSEEIIPRPHVEFADTHTLTAGGLQATGTATLSEISLTYTQGELLGEPLAAWEEFQIRISDGLGQGISDRLFIPQDHPIADREKTLGWTMVVRMIDDLPLVVA